jgi:putative NADH-flavin reductase
MNIVLAGATGNIGSRILDEALRRGHRVTGLTRDPTKLGAREGLQARKASTTEVTAFADALKGHDACSTPCARPA